MKRKESTLEEENQNKKVAGLGGLEEFTQFYNTAKGKEKKSRKEKKESGNQRGNDSSQGNQGKRGLQEFQDFFKSAKEKKSTSKKEYENQKGNEDSSKSGFEEFISSEIPKENPRLNRRRRNNKRDPSEYQRIEEKHPFEDYEIFFQQKPPKPVPKSSPYYLLDEKSKRFYDLTKILNEKLEVSNLEEFFELLKITKSIQEKEVLSVFIKVVQNEPLFIPKIETVIHDLYNKFSISLVDWGENFIKIYFENNNTTHIIQTLLQLLANYFQKNNNLEIYQIFDLLITLYLEVEDPNMTKDIISILSSGIFRYDIMAKIYKSLKFIQKQVPEHNYSLIFGDYSKFLNHKNANRLVNIFTFYLDEFLNFLRIEKKENDVRKPYQKEVNPNENTNEFTFFYLTLMHLIEIYEKEPYDYNIFLNILSYYFNRIYECYFPNRYPNQLEYLNNISLFLIKNLEKQPSVLSLSKFATFMSIEPLNFDQSVKFWKILNENDFQKDDEYYNSIDLLLKSYQNLRKMDHLFNHFFSLEKFNFDLLKDEKFRRFLFYSFQRIPVLQSTNILKFMIENFKDLDFIYVLISQYLFSIKLNMNNYNEINLILNDLLKNKIIPKLKELKYNYSFYQLYYSIIKLIKESEEFSSDIYTFKDPSYIIEDGINYENLLNDENSSLPFKGILCYLLILRLNQLSQQINIRKYNLITSSNNNESELVQLNEIFIKYFNILEEEFYKNFNQEKTKNWNVIIENITLENYFSVLWNLFSHNFILFTNHIDKKGLRKLIEFLLKKMTFLNKETFDLLVIKESIGEAILKSMKDFIPNFDDSIFKQIEMDFDYEEISKNYEKKEIENPIFKLIHTFPINYFSVEEYKKLFISTVIYDMNSNQTEDFKKNIHYFLNYSYQIRFVATESLIRYLLNHYTPLGLLLVQKTFNFSTKWPILYKIFKKFIREYKEKKEDKTLEIILSFISSFISKKKSDDTKFTKRIKRFEKHIELPENPKLKTSIYLNYLLFHKSEKSIENFKFKHLTEEILNTKLDESEIKIIIESAKEIQLNPNDLQETLFKNGYFEKSSFLIFLNNLPIEEFNKNLKELIYKVMEDVNEKKLEFLKVYTESKHFTDITRLLKLFSFLIANLKNEQIGVFCLEFINKYISRKTVRNFNLVFTILVGCIDNRIKPGFQLFISCVNLIRTILSANLLKRRHFYMIEMALIRLLDKLIVIYKRDSPFLNLLKVYGNIYDILKTGYTYRYALERVVYDFVVYFGEYDKRALKQRNENENSTATIAQEIYRYLKTRIIHVIPFLKRSLIIKRFRSTKEDQIMKSIYSELEEEAAKEVKPIN